MDNLHPRRNRLLRLRIQTPAHLHDASKPEKHAVDSIETLLQWQSHYRKAFPDFVFYFESVPDDTRRQCLKDIHAFGAVCKSSSASCYYTNYFGSDKQSFFRKRLPTSLRLVLSHLITSQAARILTLLSALPNCLFKTLHSLGQSTLLSLRNPTISSQGL